MKARDVMTSHLISVLPDVDIRAAAETMARNGISAVTVINERGELVGILSEGDLVRREELKTTQSRRSWWLEMFAFDQASEYVKAHGRKVRDAMTTEGCHGLTGFVACGKSQNFSKSTRSSGFRSSKTGK